MAAQEAVHARVEEEAQEDAPRVAQHHDEGHQRAARPADVQVAEVGPVDLRLLAGQRAQAQVRLGGRPRAQAGDDVAKVLAAAAVAALADHGVQPCGGERRELGQRREDEGAVRIDPARAQRRGDGRRAVLGEHTPHGVAVHLQLARDGAAAPVLDLVQAHDLRAQLRRDRHRRLSRAVVLGMPEPARAGPVAQEALTDQGWQRPAAAPAPPRPECRRGAGREARGRLGLACRQ